MNRLEEIERSKEIYKKGLTVKVSMSSKSTGREYDKPPANYRMKK